MNNKNNRNYQNNRRNAYDDNRPQGVSYSDRQYRPERRGVNPLIWVIAGVGATALAVGGYKFMSEAAAKVQITNVSPHYIKTQEPYNSCSNVKTTQYVANQKDGTTGAVIGGATGAVAGGIIGNQIKHGSGTIVGGLIGGATGALIGNQVQKSNQPDYIAKHSTEKKCATRYRNVRSQNGYNVQYIYKGTQANIVTQNPPAVGTKMDLEQLQSIAIQN